MTWHLGTRWTSAFALFFLAAMVWMLIIGAWISVAIDAIAFVCWTALYVVARRDRRAAKS